jgi:hypothetical protein
MIVGSAGEHRAVTMNRIFALMGAVFFVQSAACTLFCWAANYSPLAIRNLTVIASARSMSMRIGSFVPKAYIAAKYITQSAPPEASLAIYSTTGFSISLFVVMLCFYSVRFWITRGDRKFYDPVTESSVLQLPRLAAIHRWTLAGTCFIAYYLIVGAGRPYPDADIFPEQSFVFDLMVPIFGFSLLFALIYFLSNSWISVKNQTKSNWTFET